MKNKWATLVELIGVFIIIGIVALVAIPAVNSIMKGAKKSSLEQTGTQLVKSADLYYTSCQLYGGYMLSGDECFYDLIEGSKSTGIDIKDAIGVKGDIPDGLIEFSFTHSGEAKLLFQDSGYICSNLVDGNGNAVYYTSETNKVGSKFTCVAEGEVKIPEKNANITIVSGDGTSVGDELCIGTECFYVIGSDDKSVNLLAKYNIYVGSIYSKNDLLINSISSVDTKYGLQSELAKGLVDAESNRVATVFFSVSTTDDDDMFYWLNDDYSLLSDYTPSGNDYPYVFDEFNNIYKYVFNYTNKLNSLYNISATGSLINYEQLIKLGCNKLSNSCSNAPAWVTTSTYWTGSASKIDGKYTNVWVVSVEENGIKSFEEYHPYDETFAGVRPVITIQKSLYK